MQSEMPTAPPCPAGRPAAAIHARFGDGPYERTADAVFAEANKSPARKIAFAEGLEGLRAGSFEDLDDAAAVEHPKGIERSPFFATVRGNAAVALYNDKYVRDALGYEGRASTGAATFGRGFNDPDWLPDPRTTEFGESRRARSHRTKAPSSSSAPVPAAHELRKAAFLSSSSKPGRI